MKEISRRKFIKGGLLIGGAATAWPVLIIRKSRAAWARKTAVHPHVDDLRVVGLWDPEMTQAHNPAIPWTRQNELVATDIVWENMDKLACGLAEIRNPRHAWRSIFVKPPRKSWSDTVVAIKTNHISRQHTRSAVMAKVCHSLTDEIGVKPQNIHIYDACHGSDIRRSTPFAGLPYGCRIEDTWGGSTRETAVPRPWKNGKGTSKCLKHLVDGSVDILINIAMCKGHSLRFGGFSMSMKNHFGTFSPGPGHQRGGQDYLMAINQTPEILGPMDPGTGQVIYPRQQLCIVDALWASKGGPGGNPSHQPNFIAMGVFSPIVDYVVATGFRGKRMGWKPNMEATHRMLTEFGYTERDLPAGGDILEI